MNTVQYGPHGQVTYAQGVPKDTEYHQFSRRSRISRWVKLVLVTLLMSVAALAMAALAILTMDKAELQYISDTAWFCTFLFIGFGIAAALEPEE